MLCQYNKYNTENVDTKLKVMWSEWNGKGIIEIK